MSGWVGSWLESTHSHAKSYRSDLLLRYIHPLIHLLNPHPPIKNKKVHEAILAAGAYPSPLNYWGFPKSICSSINEVVIHGIPDDRPLREGDIAKFDVSLFYDGA